MVKLINKYTGTEMWVADERVEEYKAAGHKSAAFSSKAIEPTAEPVVEKIQEKKTVKRTIKATKK